MDEKSAGNDETFFKGREFQNFPPLQLLCNNMLQQCVIMTLILFPLTYSHCMQMLQCYCIKDIVSTIAIV